MVLSELRKYVSRNVVLYCSACKMTIVNEVLKITESIDHLLRQGHREEHCLCGGRKGKWKGMDTTRLTNTHDSQ